MSNWGVTPTVGDRRCAECDAVGPTRSGLCYPCWRAYNEIAGLCLACGSIEVVLNEATGTRDFSMIGESAEYPTGYGCELCA